MKAKFKSANPTVVITGGSVVTPAGNICPGVVVIEDSVIAYVGSPGDIDIIGRDKAQYEVIDARGKIVCPGFIDLHVNGGGGFDITAATDEAVVGISKGHVGCGTTGLLVAITGPTEKIALDGIRASRRFLDKSTGGARILGIHMEGPYVNPKRQGPVFRNCDYTTKPDVAKMKEYVEAANGAMKIVTLAPELNGTANVIDFLLAQGIIVSLGHSEATYEQAKSALDQGITYAAHMFNAMSGVSHSNPGAALALLLSDDRVTVEVVADGHHVHPATLKLLFKMKGLNGIVPVSDATEIVGTNKDSFILPIEGGFEVKVKDGRTWGPQGQLIGSVLKMNVAVRNLIEWTGFSLGEIINMVSLKPAQLLGLDKDIGSLEVGKKADIVILNECYEVLQTIVDGETVFLQS